MHASDNYKFDDAGLHPAMRDNVRLCGYETPTPIQAYSLPAVLTGHDLIAIAQTGESLVLVYNSKKKKKNCSLISVGSGKTAAFLIPVLSQLMGKAKKLSAPRHRVPSTYNPAIHATSAEPLVLVVAPTRELCIQIFDECRRLCYRSMLRPCVVYGGAASQEQREDLQRGCDVLIGTPGRLIDFMERPNILSLRRVK